MDTIIHTIYRVKVSVVVIGSKEELINAALMGRPAPYERAEVNLFDAVSWEDAKHDELEKWVAHKLHIDKYRLITCEIVRQDAFTVSQTIEDFVGNGICEKEVFRK